MRSFTAKRTSRSWLCSGSMPTTLMFTGSRLGNSAHALRVSSSSDKTMSLRIKRVLLLRDVRVLHHFEGGGFRIKFIFFQFYELLRQEDVQHDSAERTHGDRRLEDVVQGLGQLAQYFRDCRHAQAHPQGDCHD